MFSLKRIFFRKSLAEYQMESMAAKCIPVRLLDTCNTFPQSSSMQDQSSHFSDNGPSSSAQEQHLSHCDQFYNLVRQLTPEMLSQRVEGSENERPKQGPQGQALLARVRMFFDELKALLGTTCRGTIFDSPTALTAAACGVSKSAVVRLGNSLEELSKFPIEPPKKYVRIRSRRQERLAALKNHGHKWGDIVRQLVRNKLKEKADVRLYTLHRVLKTTYSDFSLSTSTLYRLMRALGFIYTQMKGGKYKLHEDPSTQLSEDMETTSRKNDSGSEESEGVECDFDEMEDDDEPWVLESMEKDKDDETEPFYVFRPAKTAASTDGADEASEASVATGDQTNG
ncbi:hypothetical protein COOONC_18691 [Cooperia oncophora]